MSKSLQFWLETHFKTYVQSNVKKVHQVQKKEEPGINHEIFCVDPENLTCVVRTDQGTFWTISSHGRLALGTNDITSAEQFRLVSLPDNKIAFLARSGLYVRATKPGMRGTKLYADRKIMRDHEQFKTNLSIKDFINHAEDSKNMLQQLQKSCDQDKTGEQEIKKDSESPKRQNSVAQSDASDTTDVADVSDLIEWEEIDKQVEEAERKMNDMKLNFDNFFLTEEKFEHERRFAFAWRAPNRLGPNLLNDPPHFSDDTGQIPWTERPCPEGFRWLEDWQVVRRFGATDDDGWEYSSLSFTGKYHNPHRTMDDCRRRRYIRIGVHDVKPIALRTESTYENERSDVISWTKPFLPLDRAHWSNNRGTENRTKDSVKLPSDWYWLNEWSVVQDDKTDKEGWIGAVAFSHFADTSWSIYRPQDIPLTKILSPTNNVRRRQWMRIRVTLREEIQDSEGTKLEPEELLKLTIPEWLSKLNIPEDDIVEYSKLFGSYYYITFRDVVSAGFDKKEFESLLANNMKEEHWILIRSSLGLRLNLCALERPDHFMTDEQEIQKMNECLIESLERLSSFCYSSSNDYKLGQKLLDVTCLVLKYFEKDLMFLENCTKVDRMITTLKDKILKDCQSWNLAYDENENEIITNACNLLNNIDPSGSPVAQWSLEQIINDNIMARLTEEALPLRDSNRRILWLRKQINANKFISLLPEFWNMPRRIVGAFLISTNIAIESSDWEIGNLDPEALPNAVQQYLAHEKDLSVMYPLSPVTPLHRLSKLYPRKIPDPLPASSLSIEAVTSGWLATFHHIRQFKGTFTRFQKNEGRNDLDSKHGECDPLDSANALVNCMKEGVDEAGKFSSQSVILAIFQAFLKEFSEYPKYLSELSRFKLKTQSQISASFDSFFSNRVHKVPPELLEDVEYLLILITTGRYCIRKLRTIHSQTQQKIGSLRDQADITPMRESFLSVEKKILSRLAAIVCWHINPCWQELQKVASRTVHNHNSEYSTYVNRVVDVLSVTQMIQKTLQRTVYAEFGPILVGKFSSDLLSTIANCRLITPEGSNALIKDIYELERQLKELRVHVRATDKSDLVAISTPLQKSKNLLQLLSIQKMGYNDFVETFSQKFTDPKDKPLLGRLLSLKKMQKDDDFELVEAVNGDRHNSARSGDHGDDGGQSRDDEDDDPAFKDLMDMYK